MGFVQRRLLNAVLGVVARPRLTLAISGIFLVASIILAWSKLKLSTDQDQLFSTKIQFFKDWLDFNDKFPENEALYVLVQPKDAAHAPPLERWTAIADRITERLRGMPQAVESVDSRVPINQLTRFGQALLFDPPHDLPQDFERAKQLIPLARMWGESSGLALIASPTPTDRFLVQFQLAPADGDAGGLAHLVAEGWTDALEHPEKPLKLGDQVPDLSAQSASDPSDLGYYYEPDEDSRDIKRYHLLIRVYTKENDSGLADSAAPVDAIKAASLDIAKSFPEFSVGITGRPAIDADEMRITDHDSHHAETCALIAVFIGLVVMLRSIWMALAAEICLAVGIGWTFGYATIAVGELNLLSIVFIIALIGIGMDYLVQILMRYRLEARRYVRPRAVWSRVFRYVSPPILTACLGAAGAFLVSVFTDFRGAADLGIIAGGGLLLCLLSGYTVLPALLVLFPPKLTPYEPSARYKQPGRSRSVIARLALPLVWIGLLIGGIPFAMRTDFNSNLLDLQAPNLESVKLIKKIQSWSAVAMSKSQPKLHEVRQALEKTPTVASTESILDAYDNLAWLRQHQSEVPKIQWATPAPVRAEDLPRIESEAKALAAHFDSTPETRDVAASLRRFTDTLAAASAKDAQQAAARLTAWQQQFIDELRTLALQISPPDLDEGAIPPELRSHLVSADGTYALYINPKQDLWDRANLRQFVRDIEASAAKVPNHPPVTGVAVDVYHTTGAVQRSFYAATLYALVLIFLLVLIDLRNIPQTLLAISVLAVGLPMLVVLMGMIGYSWNFANFFGLPILIGAGHEYGVFMMHRYREVLHDPRRVWRWWDVSDRALLLCAFVTSTSFGFFWWMSDHVGLKSLGFVMALGSACIYLATMMVVRPLLMLRLEWLRKKTSVEHAFPVTPPN